MITILGAGGAIGNELVKLLSARKQSFRLVGRNPCNVVGATEAISADIADQEQTIRAVAGSSVVGIATGCSILAAVAAIRRRKAARVVVAVPVAPASGCSAIRMEADEVLSVAEPELLLALSQWYQDFSQISDEDVRSLLDRSAASISRAA